MPDTYADWAETFRLLLKHFEDMEGTTYLVFEGERAMFLRDVPESVRGTIAAILELYHKNPRG